MARPRKSNTESIEDFFFTLSPAEQDQLLRTLNALARLKRRQKEPAPSEPRELDKQGGQ